MVSKVGASVMLTPISVLRQTQIMVALLVFSLQYFDEIYGKISFAIILGYMKEEDRR